MQALEDAIRIMTRQRCEQTQFLIPLLEVFPRTAHYGAGHRIDEELDVAGVRVTLRVGRPQRIGYGIVVFQDLPRLELVLDVEREVVGGQAVPRLQVGGDVVEPFDDQCVPAGRTDGNAHSELRVALITEGEPEDVELHPVRLVAEALVPLIDLPVQTVIVQRLHHVPFLVHAVFAQTHGMGDVVIENRIRLVANRVAERFRPKGDHAR